MPERIQRKRTRGWRMPAGAIYVGRPSLFGNQFKVIPGFRTPEQAVKEYRQWLTAMLASPYYGHLYQQGLKKLRGHDLACFCPLDQPCHADVLLELANKEAA